MIVVDASAMVHVLVGRPSEALVLRLAAEQVLHAPHLLDTEVLHVVRRMVASDALTNSQADSALDHFMSLGIDRYPHAPLSARVWALRHNLSAYDATYVALAEELGAQVVTTDARLANAPGLSALVDLHH